MIFTRELLWAVRRDVTFAVGRRYAIELGTRYSNVLGDTTPNMLLWDDNADLDETVDLANFLNADVAGAPACEGFVCLDCYLYADQRVGGGLVGNCYVGIDPTGQIVTSGQGGFTALGHMIAAWRSDRLVRARAAELRVAAKLDPHTPLLIVADKLAEQGDYGPEAEARALVERYGDDFFPKSEK